MSSRFEKATVTQCIVFWWSEGQSDGVSHQENEDISLDLFSVACCEAKNESVLLLTTTHYCSQIKSIHCSRSHQRIIHQLNSINIQKHTMVSLQTTVAGIPMDCCIYNASGPRTGTSVALGKVASSASGGVLAKSATPGKQTGNPMPRTWQSDDASLNSEGLPNAGIE